ncbi:uncharacterized protein HaLaN_15563 [Haematococcus lacustris]|uniref:Uncharacterized protein n=1 Tax=Haematococcus lacustris TaxID=44745 RepID=A0A699ZAL3_HAELA|nr:uncharacterized protein HaLaN_15563 [Haematococcus lacustris]
MKAEHHLDALRAAVQVVEAVRKVCTEAGKKLGVLVGAEWLNAVAKAVVTVRELGVSDRVNTQLSRLIQVMGIAELVAVTQPDPALKTRLAKAQAARAEAASKPKNSVTQERAAKHVASKARSASAAAAKGGAAASPRTKKQKAPASSPGRTGKHAKRVPDAQSGGAAPAAKLSKHAHKAARAQQEAQDVGVNGVSAVKNKNAQVAKS